MSSNREVLKNLQAFYFAMLQRCVMLFLAIPKRIVACGHTIVLIFFTSIFLPFISSYNTYTVTLDIDPGAPVFCEIDTPSKPFCI